MPLIEGFIEKAKRAIVAPRQGEHSIMKSVRDLTSYYRDLTPVPATEDLTVVRLAWAEIEKEASLFKKYAYYSLRQDPNTADERIIESFLRRTD